MGLMLIQVESRGTAYPVEQVGVLHGTQGHGFLFYYYLLVIHKNFSEVLMIDQPLHMVPG